MLVKWTVKIKNSPFFIVRIGERKLKQFIDVQNVVMKH